MVNLLEVPSSGAIKVVNWTYSSPSGWTTKPLTELAEDFEDKNPGRVVLAGINSDFFDINSNKPLPEQAEGTAVNNGEVIHAITSGRQIGFTNDGSTNSLIGGKKMQFSESHFLAIYNENGKIIKICEIDKFNKPASGHEISVYFSYYTKPNASGAVITTTPDTNSYIVENQERGYAISNSKIYGKGKISSINKELELAIGQFAIVTENEKVTKYLKDNVTIRVQQNIEGDYAECENISGCGVQLVSNGEYRTDTDDMSHNRHSRTVIGKKNDGTILMVTVDGHQPENGMYGMTYDELSAMMMYYGVEEAYNLDGGGSTTMIIKNNNEGFDVINSPSGGILRPVSNAILVVVPKVSISIEKVTDKSISFSYSSECTDVNISNFKATIQTSGYKETKEIENTEYIWNNLSPNQNYTITYSYDLEYNGNTIKNTTKPQSFTTGKTRPTLTTCSYTETETQHILNYEVIDTENCLENINLDFDQNSITLDANNNIYYLDKSEVNTPNFSIVLSYNVGAIPDSIEDEEYTVEMVVNEPSEQKPEEENNSIYLIIIIIVLALITIGTFVIVLKKKTLTKNIKK